MDALRRSTLELWQYFEKLSFNTMLYRGPAITHPSVGFYPSLNIQFVVGDLSISGTTPLTIFWARTPGLWQTTELAKHQHISHLYGQVPQVLVIAQLTLSPPAFYLYRRLGAAVFFSQHFHWKLLLAWFRYVAACFLRLTRLDTSTAVWVPLWFRYGVFSISYYFPHLFRFVGMPLRFLPFLFTWGLPSSK